MKRLYGTAFMALIVAAGGSLWGRTVDRILAQVNDDIITLSDLNREMAALRNELSTKYSGEQLELEIKKAEKDVLDELIRQKLLLQKATELGFGANVDIQVTAHIERLKKEYGLNDEQFERALAQQGMTLGAFRNNTRNQIITSGLVQEFVSSRITLLSQDIERYYRENTAAFSTPEEVTLSEIVISGEGGDAQNESRAAEVRRKLLEGEPFATLASQFSKGPTANKGGGIGTYVTANLTPEISKAIANVEGGEVTAVVKLREGQAIYKVDERKPASVRPLDEVRDEIKQRLWEQRFRPEYERFVEQLKEEAYIQVFGEIK